MLATNATDFFAHVAINNAPQEGHARNIIHPIPNQKLGFQRRPGRRDKPVDLFGTMLAVSVQNDDIIKSSVEPVAQPSFDCFAFAEILRMDNHFRAGNMVTLALRSALGPKHIALNRNTGRVVDIRNLLAQGYIPVIGQDGHTLYLVQSARSIRGGVAFNF